MTTALPSCYWFAGDTAFDAGSVVGAGSPFATLIANPTLYDKAFYDVGPRNPNDADPAPNYFLEYFNRWHTDGKSAALTVLADRMETLNGLGKTGKQILYLPGIHYPPGSANNSLWDSMRQNGNGGSASRLLLGVGGGPRGVSMATYLRGMFGFLIRGGQPLCKLAIDGMGDASVSDLARLDAVRYLEDMGFDIIVEAYAGGGTAFAGYPSLTGSTFALAQGASFDALPSTNGIFVDGGAWEAAMATWRADDRDIYASWQTVVPGPWTEFGAYGA